MSNQEAFNIQNGLKQRNKKQDGKFMGVRPKEFILREALLSKMFEVREFRGIYNIFLIAFLNLTIYTAITDLLTHGTISLGLENLQRCFGKPFIWIPLLTGIHIFSIINYYPFALWRNYRKSTQPIIDIAFYAYLATSICLFIYVPIKIHSHVTLPVASACIIFFEQVRLLMKIYAFERTNIGKVLRAEASGSFEQCLYFLYAPTLIYEDTYPRSKHVRWSFVLQNVTELVGCILCFNVVQGQIGYVLFEHFGLVGHTFSVFRLVKMLFLQMVVGILSFLIGFYVLLHTVQNIGAELLRFGDRQFYKDWWNSESFTSFYSTWNSPVHGFLHTYIYKEVFGLGYRSKVVPIVCVFIVSSIVHEYMMAVILQFFFPVLFVLFGGFGVPFRFCGKPRFGGNAFIWWSLCTGVGIMYFFYTLEYFARLNNCPSANNYFWDFVTPRFIQCGSITW